MHVLVCVIKQINCCFEITEIGMGSPEGKYVLHHGNTRNKKVLFLTRNFPLS